MSTYTTLTCEKNVLAIRPANGGKRKTHASRIPINFQPSSPSSMGNREKAINDQAVIKATIVPMLAPVRSRPAAMGMLTKGPAGVRLPISVPTRMPRSPDSVPSLYGQG